MSDSLWPHGLYSPQNSPSQNTGMGSLSLLQGIFPTQGSNPGLPHCRRILYQLSREESPRILEWGAYPFSSGSSWPRNQTGSPALHVDSSPTELLGNSSFSCFLFIIIYLLKKMYLMKFNHFKMYNFKWQSVHSYCCQTITTIHLQNFFIFPIWNSVLIRH